MGGGGRGEGGEGTSQKPRNTRSFTVHLNGTRTIKHSGNLAVEFQRWKGEKKRGSIRELGGNKGFAEPLFRVSDGLPFCVISGSVKRKRERGLLFRGWL